MILPLRHLRHPLTVSLVVGLLTFALLSSQQRSEMAQVNGGTTSSTGSTDPCSTCVATVCSTCLAQEVCVADTSLSTGNGKCDLPGPKGIPNIICPCPPKSSSSLASVATISSASSAINGSSVATAQHSSVALSSASSVPAPLPSSVAVRVSSAPISSRAQVQKGAPVSVAAFSSASTSASVNTSQSAVNKITGKGVIQVPQGYCASVPINPATGERDVYCCLDELYTYDKEGTPQENAAFIEYLNSLQKLTAAEAKPLFDSPYESRIHQKYKWTSVCGRQISCEVCQNTHFCGNSLIEQSEVCDDGPLNSDTRPNACRTDCKRAGCGDGVTDTGEQCDNGSKNSDTVANSCRTNCQLPRCGDAMKDTGEACDNGVLNSNSMPDACRLNCTVPSCGDGVADTGEECDLGEKNGIRGSGCTKACTVERISRCGDGIEDPGEMCDDGTLNANIPDRCRENCMKPLCGDGIQDSTEECDDGKRNGSPASRCSSNCTLNLSLSLINKCGDGHIDPGEQCDAAKANANIPDHCRSNCLFPRCSDGIRDSGEQCDLGEANGKTGSSCKSDCHSVFCGDGISEPGEQCDDGNLIDGDGCNSLCRMEPKKTALTYTFQRTPTKGQPVSPITRTQQRNEPKALLPSATAEHAVPSFQLPEGASPSTTGAQDFTASITAVSSPEPSPLRARFPLSNSGPATLGLIAMGSAGALAWLKRRKRRG